MADYKTVEHDVLIIGAGGAGLRAAIEVSAAGASVKLPSVNKIAPATGRSAKRSANDLKLPAIDET